MADCPFFAGSTITDPRFFVGRREALKLLSDRMQGSQPTSINVVGRHKTGKSSLLVHLQQTYGQRVANPDGYRVVYLSLQNAAYQTEASFYKEVVKELKKGDVAKENGVVGELINRFRSKNSDQQSHDVFDRQGFTTFIQGFKEKGILPVLLVDNFEELLERKDLFPNGFYDNLRFLIDSNCLMMGMASQEGLEIYSREKKITSDFFNVFQTIDLNANFDAIEAQQLIGLKNSMGEMLPEDLQAMALKWGEKEPYFLQLAGSKLWEMGQRDKSLNWAKAEFEKAKRPFKFQAKSKLLAKLDVGLIAIGRWSLSVIDNRETVINRIVGILILGIALGVLFALGYGIVKPDFIYSIWQWILGQ